MARARQVTKSTQPLPAARDEYSVQAFNNTRRIIEINFDLVYTDLRGVFDLLNEEVERLEDLIEEGGGSTPTHPPVTLIGTLDYITIDGPTQVITRNQINLVTDVVDDLPVTNLNAGAGATAATFWRGDGLWATPPVAPAGGAEYITQGFSNVVLVNVVHNFGQYPLVQVLDLANDMLIPLTIEHNSLSDFTVTFSVPSSGIVIATLGAPPLPNYRETGVDDALLLTDYILVGTAPNIRITLPDAIGIQSRRFEIKVRAASLFVETVLGQTIDLLDTEIKLFQEENMVFYSDGNNWNIA